MQDILVEDIIVGLGLGHTCVVASHPVVTGVHSLYNARPTSTKWHPIVAPMHLCTVPHAPCRRARLCRCVTVYTAASANRKSEGEDPFVRLKLLTASGSQRVGAEAENTLSR